MMAKSGPEFCCVLMLVVYKMRELHVSTASMEIITILYVNTKLCNNDCTYTDITGFTDIIGCISLNETSDVEICQSNKLLGLAVHILLACSIHKIC